MRQAPKRSNAERVPGIVNTVLAILTLVIVAVLALRATQSTPPALAEFAPTVQKTIQQAPQEQTDVFGNGAGGANGAGLTPTPAPTPKASGQSALAQCESSPGGCTFRPCIGDPPRQIEDPQSPPCVPFWSSPAGNGCNTSMGVSGGGGTSDCQGGEIVIQDDQGQIPAGMLDFFNKHFEFYKRTMIAPGTPSACANDQNGPPGANPSGQIAQADCDAKQDSPFAAMEDQTGSGISYAVEMAHNKVISTLTRPFFTETQLTQYAPYIWMYPMAQDTLQRTFAEWACNRIAGGVATHAGPPTLGQPRVYGLVFGTEAVGIPSDGTVFAQTAQSTCGIGMAYTAPASTGSESQAQMQQDAATAVIRMKTAHVTSVFFLGDRNYLSQLMQDADSQAYEPEWMITNYDLFDNANVRLVMNAPVDQLSHMFGITTVPMQREYQDRPSTWATTGQTYSSEATTTGVDEIYHQLLLLASGIQMAGANLTPDTFQSGLQGASFPNPPTPPIMEGRVGFPGTHTMTIDAAEWWWSNTDKGPLPDEQSKPGTFCYVDHGLRHSLTNPWPSGDPFFREPCDSGNEAVT